MHAYGHDRAGPGSSAGAPVGGAGAPDGGAGAPGDQNAMLAVLAQLMQKQEDLAKDTPGVGRFVRRGVRGWSRG